MATAFKPKFKKLTTFRAPVLLSRRLKILKTFSKNKWLACQKMYNPPRKWKVSKQQTSTLPGADFGQRRFSRLKKRYGLSLRFKQRCRFFYKVKNYSKFRQFALKAKSCGWTYKSPPLVYFQHLLESRLLFSLHRLSLVPSTELGVYSVESKGFFGNQTSYPFGPLQGHDFLNRSKLSLSPNYNLKGGEVLSCDLGFYSFFLKNYLKANNSRLYKKKALRRLAFNLHLRQSLISKPILAEPLPYARDLFHRWSEINSFLSAASQLENKKVFLDKYTAPKVRRYEGVFFNEPMLEKIGQTRYVKESGLKSSKLEQRTEKPASRRRVDKHKVQKSKRSFFTQSNNN